MPARKAIPAPIRKSILAEFNQRCAICGNTRPHLHHIDENPENNNPLNILPLCPNCHLGDQHDPTHRINPLILRIFREHKDPAILSPQFRPLFDRLRYIIDLPSSVATADFDEIEGQNDELARFVAELKMGSFYSAEIKRLVQYDRGGWMSILGAEDESARKQEYERERTLYIAELTKHRDAVVRLCVELIRFQDWPTKPRAQS
jgi:hypothetical protein